MAVESLECCLSRAIGSSCMRETHSPAMSPAVLCSRRKGQHRDAWFPVATAVPAQTSIPGPAGLSLSTHHRALFCSPLTFRKTF